MIYRGIIFLFLFFPLNAFSQLAEMRLVGSAQQEAAELISKEIHDANGEVCAGLIIRSDLKGLTYQSNNGIVKLNCKPGEDFLFLSPDERVVTIYLSGYVPLQIILNDAGIKLTSGQTWSLKITSDKKFNPIPVNFIVEPEGSNISIDGAEKTTTMIQQLTEGKHEIKIEKEGYKTLAQTITVSLTQNLFNFSLKEVELQTVAIASAPEGAKIYLDNVYKGETDRQIFLYPGVYTLKLAKSGCLDVQDKIYVKEDTLNKYYYTLLNHSGTLVLSVIPGDAQIFINKEDYTGKTLIELAPGRYKIDISKTGYDSTSETVDITLNQQIEKKVSLVHKKGDLQFTIWPIDARVTLKRNGSLVEQWDGGKILHSLQVGEYELNASAKGYTTQAKKITIAENRAISEDIKLQRGNSFTLNAAKIDFVYVEKGIFKMGSVHGNSDEEPLHAVTLGSFYIGKYEITQKQWKDVMGTNPSNFKGENLPVENVSWNEVQEFIAKLNAKEGSNVYRLPTEAEWEYAARGGNKSKGYRYSGSDELDKVAWYSVNSTHAVGTKLPNELGIYDMSGNVWEWCSDWYDENYYQNCPQDNPQGPSTRESRVLRGGSCSGGENFCRITYRLRHDPNDRSRAYGFRLLRQIEATPADGQGKLN